jgi:hypothetical protein
MYHVTVGGTNNQTRLKITRTIGCIMWGIPNDGAFITQDQTHFLLRKKKIRCI